MDLSSNQWHGDKYYDFDIHIYFECKQNKESVS